MKSRLVLPGLLCAVLVVSGCASPGKGAKTATIAPAAGTPEESAPIGALRLAEFIIGVGDTLEISVYRHTDLKETMMVGLSGKIMFPLVGDVQAAGRSVFALRDEITEKLSRYLVKPVATVKLIEIKSRRAMILGEVRTPGSFVLDNELSALDVLSQAGGATNDANLSRVLLVRNAAGNKKVEIYLDLKKALSGEDYAANVALQSGDILYVPTRGLASVSRYAAYLSTVLSPVVMVEGGIVLWPLVKDVFNGKPQSSQVSIPTSK